MWPLSLSLVVIALFFGHKRCNRSLPRLLIALACAGSLIGVMLPPAQAVYVYEYGLTGTPIPWGITIDKGGAVWITEQGANKIAKVGVPAYELTIPTPGSVPWGITASKDHEDIWFTEETAGKIGRFVPSENKFYEFALPDSVNARPRGITMNITKMSDGKVPRYDVWFTEFGRNRIGHLYGNATHGATHIRFSFYTVPVYSDTQPLCIAMSPIDNSIWFTEYKTSRISSIRLLENGTALFRHYPLGPVIEGNLWGIAVDPHGFIWVAESKRNCIGKLNPVSGEYVTFAIPTSNSEPHEIAVEAVTTAPPYTLLNVWFAEHSGDKIGRYDPGLNVFFEYPIISTGGRPHGIAVSAAYGSVWFTEPFVQKVGSITGWPSPPRVTVTTVGTITSAAATSQTLATTRYSASSQTTSFTGAINAMTYAYASATLVTATYTFTSSLLRLTSTSIFSYTVTSRSTSYTTSTTTTTATHISVTTSTLSTTTSTTATSTSWIVQTSTLQTSRTSTSIIISTSSTTTSLTLTSTSIYPTATVTATNSSYVTTTAFSPTVTVTSIQTSMIPTTSAATTVVTTTTTTITTAVVTRPCVIASAAYGSELASPVQYLRDFRDRTVMSTFAGSQFMRIFNNFYYAFSPTLAQAVSVDPILAAVIRTLVRPLIALLRLTSSVLSATFLNSELVTVLAGIVTSGAIGIVYAAPILAVSSVLRKKSRRLGGS